ncbi:MAG: Klebsiella phage vB KleM RaK2 [Bacteroidota bacterium]|jgi:hypothetical protein
MTSLYNADLKPLGAGQKTHYYDHATKLFLSDNLRLSPKQSFLYYVVINVNQSVGQSLLAMFNSSTQTVSSQSLNEQYEVGLMVKRIDLPKYTIATKTYNAYNRKNIVTGAIQYEPITVSFHDDAADVVNRFWNDYYTYYYRDSDYQSELYQVPHKYTNRLRTKWGFTPLNRQLIPFLKDIQIFSLHNKRFTEYKLINPTITSWRHGEHDSSQDTGIMTNSMTIGYETVKYRVGTVNPVDVNGFAVLHYDNFDSPISTSKTNIYTNAGLIGALGSAGSEDLARPDGQGSGRGVLSNLLSAYNLYNNVKNANFRSLTNATIGQIGLRAINGALFSSTGNYTVPTLSATAGYAAATSVINTNNDTVAVSPYGAASSIQQNAYSSTNVPGSSVTIGVPSVIQQTQSTVERGVETVTQQGSAASSYLFAQLAGTPNGIPINPQTGQPAVGLTRTFIVGNDGNPIPTVYDPTQRIGSFNPLNPNINVTNSQKISDGAFVTTVNTYTDGTKVGFDSNGNQLYVVQGNSTANLEDINRQVNRNLNVDTAAGVRYVTDPQTGLVTAVGGTSAQVGNTLSYGVSGIAGLAVGSQVYQALARTGLGKSVFGQVLAGSVSAGITKGVFQLTNNLVNPLINSFTGQIGAAWNSATKAIQTSVGQYSSNAGRIEGNPGQNIRDVQFGPENGSYVTYMNGDVYYVSSQGKATYLENTGASNNKTPAAYVPVDSNGNPLGANDYIDRSIGESYLNNNPQLQSNDYADLSIGSAISDYNAAQQRISSTSEFSGFGD